MAFPRIENTKKGCGGETYRGEGGMGAPASREGGDITVIWRRGGVPWFPTPAVK